MRSHLKLHFEHNQKLIYGDNNDHEKNDHDEKMEINEFNIFFAFRGQKQLAHDRNLFDLFFVCIFNWDPFIFIIVASRTQHTQTHMHPIHHTSYKVWVIMRCDSYACRFGSP